MIPGSRRVILMTRRVASYPAAVYDSFAAPTGSINGRATETGGLTWAISAYLGSNTTALSVLVAGKLSGTQGTAPQQSFGYVTTAVTDNQWITRQMALITGMTTSLLVGDHITSSGGAFSSLALASSTATGVAGALTWRPTVAGVTGTTATIGLNITPVDGDSFQARYSKPASNVLVDLYMNGRKIGAQYDLTAGAPTLPLTYSHGFRGTLPNTGPVDSIEIGDPTVAGMVTAFLPNRIIQMDGAGGGPFPLNGEYTRGALPSLEYEIRDTADASLVDWTSVASFTAASQAYTGMSQTVVSPPSAGIKARVRRGALGGGYAYSAYGPAQKFGHVVLFTGQSLTTNMWAGTTGVTLTAGANLWSVGGSLGQGGTVTWPNDADRRQLKIVDNSPMAMFGNTIQSVDTARPVSTIFGGRGGTYTWERLPGTANNDAQRDGIRHAGLNFATAIINSGQFECVTDTTKIATYAADTASIVADNEALIGRAAKWIMTPLTSVWGATDANSETLRRIQWAMCQADPTRYFWGPQLCDIQHATSDVYHFVAAGYVEEARRYAWSWLKMMGFSTYDRSGPILLSAVKDSSSQLTVTFDLNGASGLEIANSGFLGDYRGGLRFAAASSFASPLSPLLATINAVVGTTQSITYTFTGTPFLSGPGYVSSLYGTEPFNPSGDATIRANYATQASMLRGLWSGTNEQNIPIQPYYSAGGDYVTAS
jgi:hypothetical protein